MNARLTAPPSACSCLPAWLGPLVSEELKCVECRKENAPAAGFALIPCQNNSARRRVHALLVTFCPGCAPSFRERVLNNPRRGPFIDWVASDRPLSNEELTKRMVAADERLGLPTGINCGNQACGNNSTRNLPRFKICSRCKRTSYCSVECQREDWSSGHRSMCKALRGKASEEEMAELRRSGRVLPGPLPQVPEQGPCVCFDAKDLHRFNAGKRRTCSNPGCFHPVVGIARPMFFIVNCRATGPSNGEPHVLATQYCSDLCQRSGTKKS